MAAYPERADPRDVLVSEVAAAIDGLPRGRRGAHRRAAPAGADPRRAGPTCGSSRCAATSTRGCASGARAGPAAWSSPAAGLDRLGLADLPAHPIPPDVLLPAPGQGTLALEVRAGSAGRGALPRPRPRRRRRAPPPPSARVVAAFGGDCTLPLAAWAREEAGSADARALDGRLHARSAGRTPAAREAAAAMRSERAEAADRRASPPCAPAGARRRCWRSSSPDDRRRARPAPLAGLRVVVTRAAHQAEGLAAAFAAAGAAVERLPLLEVVPPADPRAAGARRLRAGALRLGGLHLRQRRRRPSCRSTGGALPPRLRVAAVGTATADALRAWEIEPALMRPDRTPQGCSPSWRRASAAAAGSSSPRPPTPGRPSRRGCAAAGAEAVAVVAYDKRLPPDAAAARRARSSRAGPLGWVTFTSPRIVRHFAELFGEDWERRRTTLRAASIGRSPRAELRRLGVEPAAEAAAPGDEELVAAVVRAVKGASPDAVPGRRERCLDA